MNKTDKTLLAMILRTNPEELFKIRQVEISEGSEKVVSAFVKSNPSLKVQLMAENE